MRQLPHFPTIIGVAFFTMSKSNLLIDETPIVFQPTLAKLIGLPEAIVLQTLKYWCAQKRCGKVVDDERWIYNTLEQWREFSFPFWSTRTIGEVFRTLETMGLIKSKQFDLQEVLHNQPICTHNFDIRKGRPSGRFFHIHLEDSS